jgi:glycosyltransferase involved in cell wall biosynthesis
MISRICVVSDAIRAPFDEGVRLFAYNLIKELSHKFEVLGIGRSNDFKGEIEKFCTKALPGNKLFLSSYLWKKIRSFSPDIIYYLPIAHATLNSFIRTRVLKTYGNQAKTVMITLQPREYSGLSKRIIPLIAPDLVLAQSEKTEKVLVSLGCRVKKIPSGVDLQKFVPMSKEVKETLREKYGFPRNKYLVLHVGHINKNRNMQIMGEIQRMEGFQAVVVGSTTYPEDVKLVKDLQRQGVITMTGYVDQIEEVYQCADCYLFPVFSEGACIEVPLSVLEAMACNLPIVTTRYGGLAELICEGKGFLFVDSCEETMGKIKSVGGITDPGTRNLVEQYSWKNVVERVLAQTGVNSLILPSPRWGEG